VLSGVGGDCKSVVVFENCDFNPPAGFPLSSLDQFGFAPHESRMLVFDECDCLEEDFNGDIIIAITFSAHTQLEAALK